MTTGLALHNAANVFRLNYGKALRAGARVQGSVPVFGSGGLVGHHDTPLTQGRAIVVGRKGSIGSVTFSDAPSWPIDTAYFIDEASTACDLRWLYWCLRNMGLSGMNKSAAVPGLNRDDVYRLRMCVPPIVEQRRIAAILDQADELRAKRRRTLALLDEALPAAFAELFHGASHATARLNDVGIVRTGRTPAAGSINSKSLGVPFVTPGDLASDKPVARYVHDIAALAKVAVPAGSLLVCCIGATVGKLALATEISMYNQQINSVEWGPSIEPAYGLFAVNELRGRIRDSAASTTMPILNKTQFSALRIPVPPMADQQAFSEVFEAHGRVRNQAIAHLAHLDELFASLQHRAFTGQL
ncbi:restriction endonuclease subunit S [Frigoribacterium sp. PhB24]|uniref:restriction endonuclease subunit S n=1 Tax=Frigoribacterium sp. PhB24 TaxID=2485204 RepID=UPI000F47A644|nr:restriction endonuclease subunit S [Frigoribacterium sp. PhB24]ROS50374.1 type I restriction enzyme S subunit [Frigoribacterium sp. PhB24]